MVQDSSRRKMPALGSIFLLLLVCTFSNASRVQSDRSALTAEAESSTSSKTAATALKLSQQLLKEFSSEVPILEAAAHAGLLDHQDASVKDKIDMLQSLDGEVDQIVKSLSIAEDSDVHLRLSSSSSSMSTVSGSNYRFKESAASVSPSVETQENSEQSADNNSAATVAAQSIPAAAVAKELEDMRSNNNNDNNNNNDIDLAKFLINEQHVMANDTSMLSALPMGAVNDSIGLSNMTHDEIRDELRHLEEEIKRLDSASDDNQNATDFKGFEQSMEASPQMQINNNNGSTGSQVSSSGPNKVPSVLSMLEEAELAAKSTDEKSEVQCRPVRPVVVDVVTVPSCRHRTHPADNGWMPPSCNLVPCTADEIRLLRMTHQQSNQWRTQHGTALLPLVISTPVRPRLPSPSQAAAGQSLNAILAKVLSASDRVFINRLLSAKLLTGDLDKSDDSTTAVDKTLSLVGSAPKSVASDALTAADKMVMDHIMDRHKAKLRPAHPLVSKLISENDKKMMKDIMRRHIASSSSSSSSSAKASDRFKPLSSALADYDKQIMRSIKDRHLNHNSDHWLLNEREKDMMDDIINRHDVSLDSLSTASSLLPLSSPPLTIVTSTTTSPCAECSTPAIVVPSIPSSQVGFPFTDYVVPAVPSCTPAPVPPVVVLPPGPYVTPVVYPTPSPSSLPVVLPTPTPEPTPEPTPGPQPTPTPPAEPSPTPTPEPTPDPGSPDDDGGPIVTLPPPEEPTPTPLPTEPVPTAVVVPTATPRPTPPPAASATPTPTPTPTAGPGPVITTPLPPTQCGDQPTCGMHGGCVNEVCVCAIGFQGPNCTEPRAEIMGCGDTTTTSCLYSIIIDAGSSSSKLFVFAWKSVESESNTWSAMPSALLSTVNQDNYQARTDRGLPYYISQVSQAGPSLEPLVRRASLTVPLDKQAETPIYVLATGLSESLTPELLDALKGSVVDYLQHNSPFNAIDDCFIVADADYVCVSNFVAANYATDSLAQKNNLVTASSTSASSSATTTSSSTTASLSRFAAAAAANGGSSGSSEASKVPPPPVAALDLGDASLNVVYATSSNYPGKTDVKLGTAKYSVYAHTFKNYGMGAANQRLLRMLSAETPEPAVVPVPAVVATYTGGSFRSMSAAQIKEAKEYETLTDIAQFRVKNVENPCYPKGYTEVNTKRNVTAYSYLEGIGQQKETVKYIGTGNYEACKRLVTQLIDKGDCESGICTLDGSPQPLPQAGTTFYALGGFYYPMYFFGLGDSASISDLEAKGREYCAKDWTQILYEFSVLSEERYLKQYCFQVAYISLLVKDGLKLDPVAVDVKYVAQVNGRTLNWALGAMLEKDFNNPRNTSMRVTVFVLGFLIAVGLVITLIATHKLHADWRLGAVLIGCAGLVLIKMVVDTTVGTAMILLCCLVSVFLFCCLMLYILKYRLEDKLRAEREAAARARAEEAKRRAAEQAAYVSPPASAYKSLNMEILPFGASLYAMHMDHFLTNTGVLVLHQKLLAYVLEASSRTEGVFREICDEGDLDTLRNRLNTCNETVIDGILQSPYSDPINIACIIKRYLRELPEPLLTYELHDPLLEAMKISDQSLRQDKLKSVLIRLPARNRALLAALIEALRGMGHHTQITKMTSKNFAVVFAPCLLGRARSIPQLVMSTATQPVVEEPLPAEDDEKTEELVALRVLLIERLITGYRSLQDVLEVPLSAVRLNADPQYFIGRACPTLNKMRDEENRYAFLYHNYTNKRATVEKRKLALRRLQELYEHTNEKRDLRRGLRKLRWLVSPAWITFGKIREILGYYEDTIYHRFQHWKKATHNSSSDDLSAPPAPGPLPSPSPRNSIKQSSAHDTPDFSGKL